MFSITGLHRLVFDLKVNGFIWSMTIHLSVFLKGVFLVIVFCIHTSLGQDLCNSYTLIKVPDASPLNQTAIIGNASESYCQSSCFNQNNCYGYTWLSGICYLNINPSINYTAPNATYYSLIRSLPNCNQAQTCSYYWYGIRDTHGFYGGQQNSINNLNDCVLSCQQTASCVAVDWNTDDNSCWIPSPDFPTGPAPGMYHFPKDCRNVTTVPTTTTTTTTTPVTPGTNMESQVTPLQTTTTLLKIRTTGTETGSTSTETGSTQSNSQGSDSSKFDNSAKSSHVALGVGVGVGVGVPVVVVIIVLVIRAVRLKTVLSQKNRNDRTELGSVQESSAVGQVRDSANNQYQQLNWNLDNSSGTTYDKLQLQTPSTIAA